MSASASSSLSRPALPVSGPERERIFWRLMPGERVMLMHAGELTITECCQWAARTPHEVPLVNGEFAFIATFTREAMADR